MDNSTGLNLSLYDNFFNIFSKINTINTIEVSKIKDIENKVSPKSIFYWRIIDTIVYFFYFLITIVIKFIIIHISGISNLILITNIMLIIGIILYPIEIFIIPHYRMKHWRYSIKKDGIHLKYGGIIKKTYKQIPLNKIYYVKKSQNIISKRLNLYSVHIGTIANAHCIPTLYESDADKVCESIMKHQDGFLAKDEIYDSNE
ncbi:PH domain-containing protein [Staphylococcus gallinarum]|uniref:PH domain-containing protein n=1 Tax=Staphylococcus gallinarum TaxID=1293 RepID=UPI001E58F80D|nr:PH domain-containing protein [Staphylococcus gallinarum]MCD8827226.1 PH domain-containing protein [Staphylococcus gallinarum]